MSRYLERVFTDHPASVDESYGQHAMFASGIAAQLFLASLAALVHAIIPCLFERKASTLIAKMHARTHGRGQPVDGQTPAKAPASA